MIKVGILVSYDWKLLTNALPVIYKPSDKIFLALDKERKTWKGNTFQFDEGAFRELIEKIDVDNKVEIYEDRFYEEALSPMQCEVRERNLLAAKMGKGGWHIQLDCDEYFIHFEDFVKYLLEINSSPTGDEKPISVTAYWVPLVKKLVNGYLYVQNIKRPQSFSVATQKPEYIYGRVTPHFNHHSPFYVVHDTWARPEKEVLQKLKNWGHADDFDADSYFNLWKALDDHNYRFLKNCYFIKPHDAWPQLRFKEASSIEEVIESFRDTDLRQPLRDRLLNVKVIAKAFQVFETLKVQKSEG